MVDFRRGVIVLIRYALDALERAILSGLQDYERAVG
jgi:hypothetical protein